MKASCKEYHKVLVNM